MVTRKSRTNPGILAGVLSDYIPPKRIRRETTNRKGQNKSLVGQKSGKKAKNGKSLAEAKRNRGELPTPYDNLPSDIPNCPSPEQLHVELPKDATQLQIYAWLVKNGLARPLSQKCCKLCGKNNLYLRKDCLMLRCNRCPNKPSYSIFEDTPLTNKKCKYRSQLEIFLLFCQGVSAKLAAQLTHEKVDYSYICKLYHKWAAIECFVVLKVSTVKKYILKNYKKCFRCHSYSTTKT